MYFRFRMRYRKLKADRIFDGYRFWDNHFLLIWEDGTIESIVDIREINEEIEEVSGILMPGLINCHCHLELSHLKNRIPPHIGLVNFLLSVVQQREKREEDKFQCIKAAEKEMFQNGIVAVADICNTIDTIETKKESNIYWYSLIEVINLHDESADKQLLKYEQMVQQYSNHNLQGVLTPHAPYSVSKETFKKINDQTVNKIVSIHNQETVAENELFQKGEGEFLKMFTTFGIHQSPFAVTGKNSLQAWLPYFTNGQTILLVHNTFITEEDIVFAKEHAEKNALKLVYCLCPNANLYIEDTLPPIDLLLKHNCEIVLGTDSYSSNWELSITSEIRTIKENFIHLPLEEVLQWATSKGAKALGLNEFGCFETGKKPGIVLLDNNTFTVKRLI